MSLVEDKEIILVGVSTRALAQSAVRAGLQVRTFDYFGDYDQKTIVPNISLQRDLTWDYSIDNLVTLILDLPPAAIIYGANFENYPEAVATLASKHQIFGNSFFSLQKVRDPVSLAEVVKNTNVSYPQILWDLPANISGDWLVKTLKSGGGHGIKGITSQKKLEADEYLQKYVTGLSLSAIFLANGCEHVLLGISQQIIGQQDFGAKDFQYVGNIFPYYTTDQVRQEIDQLIVCLTKKYSLIGINGIDFILNDQGLYLLEVNPRFTGAVELVERYYGTSLLPWHIAACLENRLPQAISRPKQKSVFAKAIYYAKKDVQIDDNSYFLKLNCADIPFASDFFRKGQPVCTLFSEENSSVDCLESLLKTANTIEANLYGLNQGGDR